MGILLNLKVCRLACIVAIFATITATVSLIIGFINMGTFHASYLETSVGIWCGLLMFAHIFMGLLMLGSRKTPVGIFYFVVNVVCLPFMIYGAIVAYNYYESFNEFRKYNEKGMCREAENKCRCSNQANGVLVFKNENYTIAKCPLYSFGEDLWLTLFVMTIVNAFWSLFGLVIGFTSLCVTVMRREKYQMKQESQSIDKHNLRAT